MILDWADLPRGLSGPNSFEPTVHKATTAIDNASALRPFFNPRRTVTPLFLLNSSQEAEAMANKDLRTSVQTTSFCPMRSILLLAE